MTKEEALKQAKEDRIKIRHRYFSPGEYLYVNSKGVLKTEENYTVKLDFWGYRSEPEWLIDWEEYHE